MRNSLALFTAVSVAVGGFGVVGCQHDRDDYHDRDANRTADTASPGSPSGDAMGRFPSGSPSNTGGQVPTASPGISPAAGVATPNVVSVPGPGGTTTVVGPTTVVPGTPSGTPTGTPVVTPGGTVVTPAVPAAGTPGGGTARPASGAVPAGPSNVNTIVTPPAPAGTVVPAAPAERIVPSAPATAPGATGGNPGGPDIGGRDRPTDGITRRASTAGGGSAGGTTGGTQAPGAGNTGTVTGSAGGSTGGTSGGTTGGTGGTR